MMIAQALFLFLAFAGSNAQFFSFSSCSTIRSRDCYSYGDNPECGTNGVTYKNRCEFAKAHCADNSIHVYRYRACRPGDFTTTTTAPASSGMSTTAPGSTTTLAPLLSGSEAVLDFFCIQLAFESCDNATETVCASDGKDYKNPCEFEKTRCTHRDLHLRHYGSCAVTQ